MKIKINKFTTHFNKLSENIQEGLNNPIPIKWSKSTNWIGYFNIDKVKYEITIDKISNSQDIYLFKFSANNSYELIKDVKKAFSTIPTIENAAREFLKEMDPVGFVFFSLDESIGRQKAYLNFCTRYSKENVEYNYREFPFFNNRVFVLFRKEIDLDDFNRSMNKLILN